MQTKVTPGPPPVVDPAAEHGPPSTGWELAKAGLAVEADTSSAPIDISATRRLRIVTDRRVGDVGIERHWAGMGFSPPRRRGGETRIATKWATCPHEKALNRIAAQ